tara:strand:+ start:320 stop:529 length:210 start_codon:yes stop_codon:yes gene_type:complete
MKDKGIKVGSGVPNKKYESEQVYELTHIDNCFQELREKRKVNNSILDGLITIGLYYSTHVLLCNDSWRS